MGCRLKGVVAHDERVSFSLVLVLLLLLAERVSFIMVGGHSRGGDQNGLKVCFAAFAFRFRDVFCKSRGRCFCRTISHKRCVS